MNVRTSRSDGLWEFFALTFALTALSFGVMAVFQIPGAALETGTEARAIGYVLFAVGGFSPSIAAFVIARFRLGKDASRDLWRRAFRFGLGARWYLIAIGIFVLAQGAQIIYVLLADGALVRPSFADRPVEILVNLPALLLLGPVSEEFGWRGFALDRLLARWSRPLTNLILGLLWSLWHLPLFFIPATSQSQLGRPIAAFLLFSLQALALTVIYTWIYRKTNRSIWAAIFLHFMTALAAYLAGSFIEGGGSFISPATIGTLVAIALLITFIEDTGRRSSPGAMGLP